MSTDEDVVKALRSYDAGLSRRQFDAKKIRIELGPQRKFEKKGHPAVRRSATFAGFDRFSTGRELTTYLRSFADTALIPGRPES